MIKLMVKSTIKVDAKTKKKPENNLTILILIRIERGEALTTGRQS